MEAAIETRALTRRFKGRTAVQEISMTVPRRAVYGFLGPNGAGKTTTLKMLLGLLRPDSGSAWIGGVDVGRDRARAVRQVGTLLEAHGFYANLTGRENLELTSRLLGLPSTEPGRVLGLVELSADGGRRIADYSLGMRQRLGLARAMLGAPPVLVLDEPGNGLDPEGMADMRRFLRHLPDATGATVLVSSHLLGEIEQVATHVGIVHGGRLLLEGRLDALKAAMPSYVVARTDDDATASALAAGSGLATHEGALPVVGKPLVLRVAEGLDAADCAARLNRLWMQAGLRVSMVGQRDASLEDLYCRVTSATRASPPVREAA